LNLVKCGNVRLCPPWRFRVVSYLSPAWKIAFFVNLAAKVRQRSNGFIGTALVGDF
jgi:hypothetical protein